MNCQPAKTIFNGIKLKKGYNNINDLNQKENNEENKE